MNCIIVDDDELSRNIMKDLVEETSDLNLIGVCKNAMEAYEILKAEQVDLVFLDIEMPKMSGLELIKNLSEIPQVILITSHSEYALESYDYGVTDFIVKPISQARFIKAVEKARKWSEGGYVQQDGDQTIFIKSDSRLVQLKKNEILYVEALGNYVIIYTEKGKYTVLSTMKEIESKLSSNEFKRIHRSFIVRVDKIESIEDNYVVIKDKHLSIGKVYKDELISSLNML